MNRKLNASDGNEDRDKISSLLQGGEEKGKAENVICIGEEFSQGETEWGADREGVVW